MPVPSIPYIQYLDSNGEPRAGGKVYTYAAGTTTPKATFTTSLGTVQAANPITLDAAGRPDHGSGNVGMIWISGSYDFLVTNADGTDPVTVPNETSFNVIEASGTSYFQSWSGDGSTVTFTASQPLGTDENAIFLFVDNGLVDYVANGNFATDTIWTKGAGWTIASGVATAVTATSDLSQTAKFTIVAGQSYTLTYTITATAGSITPAIGGTTGTLRTAAGTYTETIVAGSTQLIAFTGAAFSGTVDNVSVKPTIGIGWQVIPPTQFTLNNTSVTFATAPNTGTNNIMAFAPSTLVAAASASAAAAEASANAAGVSATLAAAQAASFTGTSTTSIAIGTGSKTLTTQTAKNFVIGEPVIVAAVSSPTSYMYGVVTAYNSGTGAITVNVTDINDNGATYASWNISLSGVKGAAGTTTPSDGTITYPKLNSAIIASTAEITSGTASKIINATNFKTWYDTNKINVGTAAATNAGTQTQYNVTGIPSTAKRVTISVMGVSTNGTSPIGIQIGPVAGVETSGYVGTAETPGITRVNTNAALAQMQGTNTAANLWHGKIVFDLTDAATNTWVYVCNMSDSASTQNANASGSKSLSAALERVRITTVGGADFFDNGKWNVTYE